MVVVMKYYELNLLISPELSQDELSGVKEKVISSIQEGKGTLIDAGVTTKKKLSVSIKGRREAYLLTCSFHIEPEKMKELEGKLKSEEKIMRFLVTIKHPIGKITARKRIRVLDKKPKQKAKEKVELKDIEEKLDEILKE